LFNERPSKKNKRGEEGGGDSCHLGGKDNEIKENAQIRQLASGSPHCKEGTKLIRVELRKLIKAGKLNEESSKGKRGVLGGTRTFGLGGFFHIVRCGGKGALW